MKRIIATLMLALFCQLLLLQDVVQVHAQKRDRYTLSVLNFSVSGQRPDRSEISGVTSRLTDELADTGYFVTMSNPDMEMALRTTDIDAFDCSNVACAIRAGQTLEVQLVVIGTIVKHPTYYYVSAQLVHITSGVVVKTVEEDITGSWYDVEAQMPVIAKKLVGQRDDQPAAAAVAVPPVRAAQTAQVADSGGGFKWYYAGLGLLVAGGVGLLLLNDSDSNTTTPAGDDDPEQPAPTPVPLPGPPTFP